MFSFTASDLSDDILHIARDFTDVHKYEQNQLIAPLVHWTNEQHSLISQTKTQTHEPSARHQGSLMIGRTHAEATEHLGLRNQ